MGTGQILRHVYEEKVKKQEDILLANGDYLEEKYQDIDTVFIRHVLKDSVRLYYEANKPIEKLLGMYSPWPARLIVKKLIEASEILLHRKNYDSDGWELISIAVEEGKKLIEEIEAWQKTR